MIPGSQSQLFEQRMASLNNEIDELVEIAKNNPAITAEQDPRTQLLLSYLMNWRRETEAPRVVRFRR